MGDLFSLTDESEMGHIRLSREADLLVVVPATANILARMAQGLADDLATTVLLATDKPVLAAPLDEHAHVGASRDARQYRHADEPRHPVRRPPAPVIFACGEVGDGRLADVMDIVAAIDSYFAASAPLAGKRRPRHQRPDLRSGSIRCASSATVHLASRATPSPTALARLGADTTLISGPVALPDPAGVRVVHIESAREMLDACKAALPADVAVCAAAVADWRAKDAAGQKMKKGNTSAAVARTGRESRHPRRAVGRRQRAPRASSSALPPKPRTSSPTPRPRRAKKNCDWIVANDVSAVAGVFGGDDNTVHLISEGAVEDWPRMAKDAVADQLAARIRDHLSKVA